MRILLLNDPNPQVDKLFRDSRSARRPIDSFVALFFAIIRFLWNISGCSVVTPSDVREGTTMETFWKDLRYAFRMLWKSPGFTLIAMLALGLGIGANTAIFSVFNGVLWRPLPVKDPQQLVILASKTPNFDFPLNLSYPDFQDYRQLRAVFSDLIAHGHRARMADLRRKARLDDNQPDRSAFERRARRRLSHLLDDEGDSCGRVARERGDAGRRVARKIAIQRDRAER